MDLVKYVEFKRKLRKYLEEKLSPESISKASQDHHSKRPPRPCGMTVHTGIGCSLCCTYCYIYDMGFPRKVTKYPLTGLEMLYALTINPYFAPGRGGTMIAMGAVSEPFLQETLDRSLEYIKTFGTIGNPTQISTKVPIDEHYVKIIAEACPHISFLVTVISLRNYRKLEPLAPNPEDRLRFCGILTRYGIHVSIFMRPIIPGITDVEAEDILNIAKSYGVKNVVLGTLRVTKRIFKNLLKVGIDLSNRISRLSDRDQYPIKGHDLKIKIFKIAEKLGFKVFEAACGANIEASNLACIACEWGPCGDLNKLPEVSEKDIVELCRELGYEVESVSITGRDEKIQVHVKSGPSLKILEVWLKELTRRKVLVRRV